MRLRQCWHPSKQPISLVLKDVSMSATRMKKVTTMDRQEDMQWTPSVTCWRIYIRSVAAMEGSDFRHTRLATDDKGDPPKCPQCRHNVEGFSDQRPRESTFLRWTPLVDRPVNLQELMDKLEETKSVSEAWTDCLSCGEQVKVRAVSEF